MYYIGVDLGGTNIAIGLVNEKAEIVHKESVKTALPRPASEVVKSICDLTNQVVKNAGVCMDEVKSIGVGLPGCCDNKNGILVSAVNLGYENVPFRQEINKYIDKPVFLENDASVAALAEYINFNEEMECFVAITLGTGVGGGVIINGKIFSGFNGAGTELGHTVINVDGNACNCGRKGCWETYASATGLIRLTKEEMEKSPDSIMYTLCNGELGKVSGRTSFQAAKQGDEAGKRVVDKYIKYVAEGITNIINIFQPEKLVIGGGVCGEGDYLLNPIVKYVNENQYVKKLKSTEISIAKLGNDAGIIGAAMLGL
ncbi:MAG: ROK family protein [Clostridia bacterium]|nr:ROK family protein [Clostridia bacterium]